MKSLYDEISDMIDKLDASSALLSRMRDGDANAARELSGRCKFISYEGDVLCFNVDRLIGEVLADEDVPEEG